MEPCYKPHIVLVALSDLFTGLMVMVLTFTLLGVGLFVISGSVPHRPVGLALLIVALIAGIIWRYTRVVCMLKTAYLMDATVGIVDPVSRRRSSLYSVDFAYTVDGVEYTSGGIVPRYVLINHWRVGETLPVLVSAERPGWAYLRDSLDARPYKLGPFQYK